MHCSVTALIINTITIFTVNIDVCLNNSNLLIPFTHKQQSILFRTNDTIPDTEIIPTQWIIKIIHKFSTGTISYILVINILPWSSIYFKLYIIHHSSNHNKSQWIEDGGCMMVIDKIVLWYSLWIEDDQDQWVMCWPGGNVTQYSQWSQPPLAAVVAKCNHPPLWCSRTTVTRSPHWPHWH